MKDLKKKILVPIKQYYISLLLFVFATIQLMITIKNDYYGVNVSDSSIKLTLTLIYGAIVALIIRSILNRISDFKIRTLLYLLIPVLMALVYFVVLNDINSGFQIFKYFILCLLTSILFLVIPFIKKEEDSDYYSYKVFISLFLTGLCYLLLIIGIFFTMQSISSLFDVVIKDYIYMEISVFILGVIMPTLFLAGLPNKEEKHKQYPDFIKKILMYIVFPILTVYTIVLYSYFIKILLEYKLPSNLLGNLVIYYSIISIIVLYFSNKIKNENKWTNHFIKIYPYTLIIPMFMMWISLIIRIKQYGFTEPRYYAVICFIFVIASIFIIKFKNSVKYIPLTLSILLFISIFGPLSATSLSKFSQEQKLIQILKSNNMLKDNKIIKNPNLGKTEQQQVNNILQYFQDTNSLDDIDILPKNFELKDTEKTFGFIYDNCIDFNCLR